MTGKATANPTPLAVVTFAPICTQSRPMQHDEGLGEKIKHVAEDLRHKAEDVVHKAEDAVHKASSALARLYPKRKLAQCSGNTLASENFGHTPPAGGAD